MNNHETDILIIGAGPCGLFTVFEAGLLNLRCHLIDVLPTPGGQLTEIYPKKPIYDIPGYPMVLASELVQNLLKQIEPFKPVFTLGETAMSIEKLSDGSFIVTSDRGTTIKSKIIVIAAGLGSFEPRKPQLSNLEVFEGNGVDYYVKDPEKYSGKNVIIAGGGDSALDWAIFLADKCQSLTVIHRRSEFRGAPDSVERLKELVSEQKVRLITNAEVKELHGKSTLETIVVHQDNGDSLTLECEFFIPLFGLTPKLGPIADWGLNLEKNAIPVNTLDYSTNIPGIFAIGDINTYPGKLKLILCGFHEATLMVQSAYKIIHSGKNPSFKYTTVTGIKGIQ